MNDRLMRLGTATFGLGFRVSALGLGLMRASEGLGRGAVHDRGFRFRQRYALLNLAVPITFPKL